MYRYSVIFILLCAVLSACSTSGPGIFRKQSFHEQYGQKIDAAGLKETALGARWFQAAAQALQEPAAITIPYRENGYFASENPSAVGLRFTAIRGQKLLLQLEKKGKSPFTLYLELWKPNAGTPSLLSAFDTTKTNFEFEVEEDGEYLLRLQPELLASGEYSLSISTGPSLRFPVAGPQARIGSIWGDARDAGARQHEGIDIFAPKRTPAIAAAEGTISRVNENNLGGKVVWLRPADKNYTLYYAHLDEQLVSDGQRVVAGDTIGLVGNTGNARTTPPHLHFGIYGFGGAINPLPFVQPGIRKPIEIRTAADFEQPVRLTTPVKTGSSGTYRQHTIAFPLAQTVKGYRVLFPDQTIMEIDRGQHAQNIWRKGRVRDSVYLLDAPIPDAPRKKRMLPGTEVSLYGVFDDFTFVNTGSEKGWLLTRDIR